MIVIIGSDGFVGRHLTVEAVRRSIPLTLVSRSFDSGFLDAFAPRTTAITAKEFASAGHDRILTSAIAVVYLASRSVPGSSIDQPGQELTQNVGPAFAFFRRLASVNPEALLIYVSSGGTVYGRTSAARIAETHPLRPISPYGLGKRLAEDTLRYCGDAYGQRFAILRVSNPVGRWHRDMRQGLVTAILRAICTGAPLDVFGDGSAVRDYLDADDLADAILRTAASEARAGVWNVGSGKGRSVLEIVDLVAKVAGERPEIRFTARRSIDVERCVLSNTRIRKDLGWRPAIPLRRSIENVVKYA